MFLTEKLIELSTNEEATVYSQVIHYANRMVFLIVPVDVASKQPKPQTAWDQHSHTNTTNRYYLNIILIRLVLGLTLCP